MAPPRICPLTGGPFVPCTCLNICVIWFFISVGGSHLLSRYRFRCHSEAHHMTTRASLDARHLSLRAKMLYRRLETNALATVTSTCLGDPGSSTQHTLRRAETCHGMMGYNNNASTNPSPETSSLTSDFAACLQRGFKSLRYQGSFNSVPAASSQRPPPPPVF